MVDGNEFNHALNDLAAHGLRLAVPCFPDDLQRLGVNLRAYTLKLSESGVDAAHPVAATFLVEVQMNACRLRRMDKGQRLRVFPEHQSPHPDTGSQCGGLTKLLGEQQRLILLGQIVIHLAFHKDIVAAVQVLPGGDGVLAVEHIVVAAPATDLRFIGKMFVEFVGNGQ